MSRLLFGVPANRLPSRPVGFFWRPAGVSAASCAARLTRLTRLARLARLTRLARLRKTGIWGVWYGCASGPGG
jgi:hypothetical protein